MTHSASSLEPAPPNLVRLVLQPAGPAVTLSGPEVVIGRHSSAQVRLPMPNVSRRHCRLLCDGEAWRVEDLGSLNGITLNGARVWDSPLRDGDVLGIVGLTFSVVLGAGLVLESRRPAAATVIPSVPPQARKAS
jgi:pSer/pThr/pTyr-binding forkhead associated (FHA) protein